MAFKLWLIFVLSELMVVLALLFGIAKCWSIARRPATNAKCVVSLQLVLIGWLVWIGYLCFSTVIGAPLPFVRLISTTSSGIVLAAAVLAVVGLREYSRGGQRFRQGRTQAVCALIASGLMTVFPILVLVEARWNILGASNAPAGARFMVFDDLNFRFYAPGGRWVEVQTNSLDQNATFVLTRKRPEIDFIVLARKAPSAGYSVSDLAEGAKRSLSNTVDVGRVAYSGPTRINQMEGLRYDFRVERAGQQFYYQTRLFVRNGFTYQLISWGRQRDEADVAEAISYLAGRFELLR